MLRSKSLLVLFFLGSTTIYAQLFSTKNLEGQIKSADKDVADVHVLNTTSNRATITDEQGYFNIAVQLNDTLFFSAVQYRKKKLIITLELLESRMVFVTLEPFTNVLDEVIVRPFNLSGDLSQDMKNLGIEPVVTASTMGLPNAHVKSLTQSERLLKEAAMPKFNIGMLFSLPVNPLLNAITGRTKMLKNRVKVDKQYARTQRVQAFYVDSLFVTDLKIPIDRIDDFMYFCEVDDSFNGIVDSHDHLKIWEFLKAKSYIYRRNNSLD